MAANDRNNPVNRPSSDSQLSLIEFMRAYPDDAACLDRLWRDRYAPDGITQCERERKFHRTTTRASYMCNSCGLHIPPDGRDDLRGIVHVSTALVLRDLPHHWHSLGISANQLERELGVSYKTAWRMFDRIRNELMNDTNGTPLEGEVEVDETGVAWQQADEGQTLRRRSVA